MSTTVQFDPAMLERFGARLRQPLAAMPRAMAAAVDATLGRQREALRAPGAGPQPTVTRQSAQPSAKTIQGELRSTRIRVPLKQLGARQTPQGVVYQLGGRQRFIRGAFGPDIPALDGEVFRRLGKRRLPIRELYAYPRALRRDTSVAGDTAAQLTENAVRRAGAALVGKEGA